MEINPELWKEKFALGIPEIDDEHKILLDCLSSIINASGSAYSNVASFEALEKLTDYTRIHFTVEECLMRLFNYPELAAHQKDHQYFIEQIGELRTHIISEDVSTQIATLLMRWLLNHIKHIDGRYVEYFRNKQLLALITQKSEA